MTDGSSAIVRDVGAMFNSNELDDVHAAEEAYATKMTRREEETEAMAYELQGQFEL